MLITYGGLEALAWWLAKPRVVKFYKWDEQSWWNFKADDLETWPKQLVEFEQY